MLPGPSASEVTTLWCYTNVFIIIVITVILNVPKNTNAYGKKVTAYFEQVI